MYKVFNQEELKLKGKAEVLKLKERVMISDASVLVREKNLEAIEVYLNGGVKTLRDKSILEDIKASKPDTSDIGGHD